MIRKVIGILCFGLTLFSASCLYKTVFESKLAKNIHFLTIPTKGHAYYEGIIFWTPEYAAFIFNFALKGIHYSYFPTDLSYHVKSISDDKKLFSSSRKFNCNAALIKFRGKITNKGEILGQQMYLGSVKIEKVFYYKLLSHSEVKTILKESSWEFQGQ
ncbi:MAG: hypothetical protein GXO69_06145 [Acidobacteria bacterium]|nr:hypothetical protein [Acidobacteriota bacterium]